MYYKRNYNYIKKSQEKKSTILKSNFNFEHIKNPYCIQQHNDSLIQ